MIFSFSKEWKNIQAKNVEEDAAVVAPEKVRA